jgi:hypothetical protein
MVDRTVVAGAVALAGLLALTPPIEALGRGMGGGIHAGFHRPATPAFHAIALPATHRAPVPASSRPVVPASPRTVVQVPVRRMAAFRLRRFGARQHRNRFGYAVGDGTPYYGNYGAYPPADYGNAYPPPAEPAAADDAALDGPPDLRGGPTFIPAVPACRAQEYVVPNQRGERRTVRVLRC